MQYHIPHRTIFFRTTAMLALATALLITALPTRGQETLPIATKEALQRKIQEKTKELEQINKEISSTKATLNSIAKRRRSLQRELAILQNNERKLALDIQSDRISIQKLNLEIQSINLDIAAIEEQLHDKKEAIGDLFRKIQRTDQVSPMMLFLKSNTLADGVAELKALQDLNARLSVDVATLFSLQQSLAEKLRDLDAKRRDATLHKQNLEARKALIADQKEEQRQLIQETKQKEEIYEARVAE
ncbi:hypothetical protein D6779_02965 [Candidatus Parcubacteria bacterium]|nr:MAG: hypothetical protein D6779_02965 [Candidatus Parcubacteria bacterium]